MNAIYGVSDTNGSKLTEPELNCPNCDTAGTTEIEVRISYLHIFWIPFMPIAKKGASRCSSCNLSLDNDSFEEPITGYFSSQISNTKTPIKLFTLTIILSVLMVAAIVLSVVSLADNGLGLLSNPKQHDGYALMEDNAEKMQCLLDEVTIYSYSFLVNSKESDEIIKIKTDHKLVKIIGP